MRTVQHAMVIFLVVVILTIMITLIGKAIPKCLMTTDTSVTLATAERAQCS